MNLEDLVDENGLQQDEWSVTAPTFGKDVQLTVVGWSGRSFGGYKFYIVKCNECSQDRELFGGGYFRIPKGGLLRGGIPCGCSKKPEWSLDQYTVLCSRKGAELGYKFLGFAEQWVGNGTKIHMFCEKHGEWSSGVIKTLINLGYGCPKCGEDSAALANTKSDDIIIQSFFASGAFHPSTEFWKSERTTPTGSKCYWHSYCPECMEYGESCAGDLQKGYRACGCSKMRQKEAYINLVMDDETVIAIKFGIARNSEQRVKNQNRLTTYKLLQSSVYLFPSVESCKKAERECRQELECGVVLKRDMKDGYTETTWLSNLEKIIEIYQRNGGILK